MQTYTAKVTLTVKVEAFDRQDALDRIFETVGPGDDCGLEITEYGVTDIVEFTD